MGRRGLKRVLGIEPCTRGFGWAVMEGTERLVDWGVTTTRGAEVRAFAKIRERYEPDAVAFPEYAKPIERLTAFQNRATLLQETDGGTVVLLPYDAVVREFAGCGAQGRRSIAKALSNQFRALGRVDDATSSWWRKDGERIAVFSAVALAITAAK